MRKLTRSSEDRVLVGICAGFAEYFQVDPTLVRILWLLASFFGGFGLVAYGLALFLIPEKPGTDFSYHPRDIIPGKESPWSYVFLFTIILFAFRSIPFFRGILHLFFFGIFRLLPFIVALGIIYWVISSRNPDFNWKLIDWHLSTKNRLFLGVCAGLGESLNLDPVIVRIIWGLGSLFSGPIGILLYFAAYYFLLNKPVIHE
ncbi:MAG: PspC domain-containing protein [Fidelibacterota bacterium]